jgi:hypothetical protein
MIKPTVTFTAPVKDTPVESNATTTATTGTSKATETPSKQPTFLERIFGNSDKKAPPIDTTTVDNTKVDAKKPTVETTKQEIAIDDEYVIVIYTVYNLIVVIYIYSIVYLQYFLLLYCLYALYIYV